MKFENCELKKILLESFAKFLISAILKILITIIKVMNVIDPHGTAFLA